MRPDKGVRRKPDVRYTRTKSVGQSKAALTLFYGSERHVHAEGARGRDLLQGGVLWNDEIEIAFAAEEGDLRLRAILNYVFFRADEFVASGLKDDHVIRGINRFGILGDLEDLYFDGGTARERKVLKLTP